MPRRGVYMVGGYPRYMTRTQVRIDTITFCGSRTLNEIRRAVPPNIELIEEPFNMHTANRWTHLEQFGYTTAAVLHTEPESVGLDHLFNATLELWYRTAQGWLVDIQVFSGWTGEVDNMAERDQLK